MRKTVVYIFAVLMAMGMGSCGKEGLSYPYEEHEILYLGIKGGLTSSSSDAAFNAGLDDVLQKWLANNPSSSNEFIFDGVRYEFTNMQEWTGGVPNDIWDSYWENLDKHSYEIGSCWGFSVVRIPSKGATGTAYVLYTIVTSNVYGDGEVSYVAVRGDVSPV